MHHLRNSYGVRKSDTLVTPRKTAELFNAAETRDQIKISKMLLHKRLLRNMVTDLLPDVLKTICLTFLSICLDNLASYLSDSCTKGPLSIHDRIKAGNTAKNKWQTTFIYSLCSLSFSLVTVRNGTLWEQGCLFPKKSHSCTSKLIYACSNGLMKEKAWNQSDSAEFVHHGADGNWWQQAKTVLLQFSLPSFQKSSVSQDDSVTAPYINYHQPQSNSPENSYSY